MCIRIVIVTKLFEGIVSILVLIAYRKDKYDADEGIVVRTIKNLRKSYVQIMLR
jgi:hypothetical protein